MSLEDELVDSPGSREGRKTPETELIGEEELHQEPKPEDGHRDTAQGEEPSYVVDPLVLSHGRYSPQRYPDGDLDEDRRYGELGGGREEIRDDGQDRLPSL